MDSTIQTGRTFKRPITVIALIVFLAILVAIILPAIQQVREAARHATTGNEMRQIALAMHNFESAYQHFPTPSVVFAPEGPSYSMFMAIVPFIEASDLFDRVDHQLTWNHPLNAPYTSDYYHLKSEHETLTRDRNGFGLTHFAGVGEVLDREGGAIWDELDGSDFMLGEVCDGYQAWASPGHVRNLDKSQPFNSIRFDKSSFGSPVRSSATFVMVDGSLRTVESPYKRPNTRSEDTIARPQPARIKLFGIRGKYYDLVKVGAEQKGFLTFWPGEMKARDKKYIFHSHDNKVQAINFINLSKSKNIAGLDLFNVALNDDGLRAISSMRDLETLIIRANTITPDGFRHLEKMKSLRAIKLFDTSKLPKESIESLRASLPNCDVIEERWNWVQNQSE